MKKPTQKSQPKKVVKQEKKKEVERPDDHFELVVDEIDDYLDERNRFFIHPKRFGQLFFVGSKVFDNAIIQRSDSNYLTPKNLFHVLCRMKVDSTIRVIVHQPISITQAPEAKLIESNMKSAGFANLEINEVDDPSYEGQKTLCVSGIRPEKHPNTLEIELERQTVIDNKGKDGK